MRGHEESVYQTGRTKRPENEKEQNRRDFLVGAPQEVWSPCQPIG